MFALVLTGPPGAGKRTVLEALSDALVYDVMAHATLETEALTATHPQLRQAEWLAHIEAACRLHRRQGRGLLLVATTAESDADLSGVLRAIGVDEHVVVRLEAEPRRWRGGSSSASPRASLGSTSSSPPPLALVLSSLPSTG